MTFKQKVLIVDDDTLTRQLVVSVLKRLDFVDLLEACSAEEAIKIAQDEQPDLVLMDIVMPGTNGYEACKQIKNNPNLIATIVILMTSLSMREIDDQSIQAQADDLLRKPLDASELYFRIKSYLAFLKPEKCEDTLCESVKTAEKCSAYDEESAIDLGRSILYQPDIKSLFNNNRRVPLMKQEILLLEAFLQNRNKVLCYAQLVEYIAINGDSTIANVRTLVKLLRKKTYKELIHTLPSIGYRLVT